MNAWNADDELELCRCDTYSAPKSSIIWNEHKAVMRTHMCSCCTVKPPVSRAGFDDGERSPAVFNAAEMTGRPQQITRMTTTLCSSVASKSSRALNTRYRRARVSLTSASLEISPCEKECWIPALVDLLLHAHLRPSRANEMEHSKHSSASSLIQASYLSHVTWSSPSSSSGQPLLSSQSLVFMVYHSPNMFPKKVMQVWNKMRASKWWQCSFLGEWFLI